MNPQAILFDLDGTLLDTVEDMGDAMNRVLSAQRLPVHPIDSYRFFIGDGAVKLVTRALPEYRRDDETIGFCLKAYLADYNQNWKVKTKPYDGIEEMLDALSVRGLKLTILSNKPHTFTQRCVVAFLPRRIFDIVLGERDGVPLKPDPAAALEIAHALGIQPKDFICVGDNGGDMQMAAAAGMFPAGALWGYRTADELLAGGARALIDRPLQILKLLN